ncbi:oxidative stress-induced growth inhibitor 1-like [Octopus sinensis]|uniref:Oxidative stress-induced growth inhibitor 1-like n=1 Tax=Octopus sinensis TaxID=2607531 RepID=A0A7E6EJN1_9MOLL|nr:oxidative stress-induced growth inhibitor 1-like [Octopus sinensis]
MAVNQAPEYGCEAANKQAKRCWLSLGLSHSVELTDPKRYRPTVDTLQRYYSQYPYVVGITEHQRPPFLVQSVQQVPACPTDCPSETFNDKSLKIEWQVIGKYSQTGQEVVFRARHIILALGRSHDKIKLQVETKSGSECPLISSLEELRTLTYNHPLLIVGSGLDAADKILFCRRNNISVIHVYRKTFEAASELYAPMDPLTYPEYIWIRDLILSKHMEEDSWTYTAFDSSLVSYLDVGHQVWVKGIDNCHFFTVLACGVLPCLGYSPHVLEDFCGLSVEDLVMDSSTYESVRYPRLFVLGSLSGDRFVRFAKGGVISAVSNILSFENSQKS